MRRRGTWQPPPVPPATARKRSREGDEYDEDTGYDEQQGEWDDWKGYHRDDEEWYGTSVHERASWWTRQSRGDSEPSWDDGGWKNWHNWERWSDENPSSSEDEDPDFGFWGNQRRAGLSQKHESSRDYDMQAARADEWQQWWSSSWWKQEYPQDAADYEEERSYSSSRQRKTSTDRYWEGYDRLSSQMQTRGETAENEAFAVKAPRVHFQRKMRASEPGRTQVMAKQSRKPSQAQNYPEHMAKPPAAPPPNKVPKPSARSGGIKESKELGEPEETRQRTRAVTEQPSRSTGYSTALIARPKEKAA